MPSRKIPEALVERLFVESKANEDSIYANGYYVAMDEKRRAELIAKFTWHVNHSLSPRQKQVLKLHLIGCTEREIATQLGVTQQVVHIYKVRAFNKLHEKLR